MVFSPLKNDVLVLTARLVSNDSFDVREDVPPKMRTDVDWNEGAECN
jgi:hypothetical protein